MLCVLNRLKKSKMDEIGWNREKSQFQGQFHDFNKIHTLKQNFPPCSSCPAPIGCANAQSHDIQSLQNMWILSTYHKEVVVKSRAAEIKESLNKSRAAEIKVKAIILNFNLIQIFPHIFYFYLLCYFGYSFTLNYLCFLMVW